LGATRAHGAASWARLEEHLEPVSIGFEGDGVHAPRAKVYARFRQLGRLDRLGVPAWSSPAMRRFLERVIGNDHVGRSGVVPSFVVDPATGLPAAGKVDVCGHCLLRSGARWQETLEALAADLGLRSPALGQVLEREEVSVAFVGLGVDAAGRTRLNAYLKEP